jgi:hypothetical protein
VVFLLSSKIHCVGTRRIRPISSALLPVLMMTYGPMIFPFTKAGRGRTDSPSQGSLPLPPLDRHHMCYRHGYDRSHETKAIRSLTPTCVVTMRGIQKRSPKDGCDLMHRSSVGRYYAYVQVQHRPTNLHNHNNPEHHLNSDAPPTPTRLQKTEQYRSTRELAPQL